MFQSSLLVFTQPFSEGLLILWVDQSNNLHKTKVVLVGEPWDTAWPRVERNVGRSSGKLVTSGHNFLYQPWLEKKSFCVKYFALLNFCYEYMHTCCSFVIWKVDLSISYNFLKLQVFVVVFKLILYNVWWLRYCVCV